MIENTSTLNSTTPTIPQANYINGNLTNNEGNINNEHLNINTPKKIISACLACNKNHKGKEFHNPRRKVIKFEKIKISDGKGITLITQDRFPVSVDQLSSGIYYISIVSDGITSNYKFIKR